MVCIDNGMVWYSFPMVCIRNGNDMHCLVIVWYALAMVRYGMVWYDIVWYALEMIWYGMACLALVWYALEMVWYDMVCIGIGMIWYGMV